MNKLLQIVIEGNTGSTGTIAEGLGNMVIEKGWKSYIAHGRLPRPSNSNIIKIGNFLEIALHGLETRIFDRHGEGSVLGTKLLIRKIKNINPDIIHLHHIHGYYINIKVLFDFLENSCIPVVWTFHDCWSLTGHCSYFDDIGCEKWKKECNNCPQIRSYPKSLFIDGSKRNFYLKKQIFNSVKNLKIISVSQWLDNLVGQSFLKLSDHDFIYNGVNTEIFKESKDLTLIKAKYNLNNKTVLLGVASTWEKRKGLIDFLELSKFLKPNQKLLLVGLNKKQLLNLPNNIIGISKTENKQELVDLYSVSDIFLNPSVEETFGLVTAEALSCGTPAIVYDRTASPEIVDENTGIIVPAKNIKLLYHAILEIEKKGKKFYSQKCRDRVLIMFNEKKNFNKYFDLYKKLIP